MKSSLTRLVIDFAVVTTCPQFAALAKTPAAPRHYAVQ
jgi:hypothetical protein